MDEKVQCTEAQQLCRDHNSGASRHPLEICLQTPPVSLTLTSNGWHLSSANKIQSSQVGVSIK